MEPHCQASGQSKDQAGLVKAYRVLKDFGRYNHLLGMQNTEFVHSQTFGHVGGFTSDSLGMCLLETQTCLLVD